MKPIRNNTVEHYFSDDVAPNVEYQKPSKKKKIKKTRVIKPRPAYVSRLGERTSKPVPTSKDCKNCKRSFKPSRYWQDFCRNICRSAFHNRINKQELECLEAASNG